MSRGEAIPRCRSCNAAIAWVKTKRNKNMPVNRNTWSGEKYYERDKHTSHFDTCPDRDTHRRGSKPDNVQGTGNQTRQERDFANQMEQAEDSLGNQELDFSDPRDHEDPPF